MKKHLKREEYLRLLPLLILPTKIDTLKTMLTVSMQNQIQDDTTMNNEGEWVRDSPLCGDRVGGLNQNNLF